MFNWADPQFANLFKDLNTPAPPAPFVPRFEENVVYRAHGAGGAPAGDIAVNDEYYATVDTANWLQKKFGAARVEFGAFDSANIGPGGMDVYADTGSPAYPRMLAFTLGAPLKNNYGAVVGQVTKPFLVNAGQLAKFYRNNPEGKFPSSSITIGMPPQTVTFPVLSLAEQYVWRELLLWAQQAATAEVEQSARPT